MGTVFKKGNWWLDFRVDGRRRRKKVGPSKALADAVWAKTQVQIAENRFLDVRKEQKVRFDDFAHEFYENYCKINHRSPNKASGSAIKVLVPYFGGRFLHEITPQLIEQFKRDRLKDVCPSTVNRALSCLKSLFNRAIEWDKYDGENPVKKVKLFPENNQRTRFLEKEQIAGLIAACDSRLRPIVIVAVNTGMRKSELLNLRWSDIDFERGVIYLLRTKNNEKREIPMNEAVKTAFISVRKDPICPYIFHTKNGEPFLEIRKLFAKALMKAGITNFRYHDLRHTFASQLAMSQVDMNTIRELLGHKSLRMTLRYSHLSLDHKKRAVEVLDRKMDGFRTPKEPEVNNEILPLDATLINASICKNVIV